MFRKKRKAFLTVLALNIARQNFFIYQQISVLKNKKGQEEWVSNKSQVCFLWKTLLVREKTFSIFLLLFRFSIFQINDFHWPQNQKNIIIHATLCAAVIKFPLFDSAYFPLVSQPLNTPALFTQQ